MKHRLRPATPVLFQRNPQLFLTLLWIENNRKEIKNQSANSKTISKFKIWILSFHRIDKNEDCRVGLRPPPKKIDVFHIVRIEIAAVATLLRNDIVGASHHYGVYLLDVYTCNGVCQISPLRSLRSLQSK